MPVPTRSKSTTQAPDTRRTGIGTASTSRLANGTTRTHGRTNSYASSTRTAPGSRTTNGSYSATVGPGSRPASSMGFSRQQSSVASARRYPGPTTPRAASALGTHDEEPNGSVKGNKKGMQQSPSIYSYGSSLNGHLLCDSMSALTLDTSPPAGLDYKPQHAPDGSPICMVPKVPVPSTPVRKSPSRPQSSRPKSFPKRNPYGELPFLTKSSTTRVFNNSIGAAPWDYDARENNMEEFFNMMVSRISQAGQDSFGLKEALELYKTRGKEDAIAVRRS